MRCRRQKKTSGLALLEIMVAFAILAMVLIPFLRTFSTTSKGVMKGGEYTAAIFLCQKIIEDIRYDLYNEDSTDFEEFLDNIDKSRKNIAPGDGECNSYFLDTLQEDDPLDSPIIKQVKKYTVEISCDTVDVDGDVNEDPDAALITVTVTWKEKVPSEDEEKEREVKFSTVISKAQNELREDI